MSESPYNPLDKPNLAKSIEVELLERQPVSLNKTTNIVGAGVYVIYYAGDFEPYQPLATKNRKNAFSRPIYVGKAIPKGGRKGGLTGDSSTGRALADRLGQHAQSIEQSTNLKIEDFFVRHLVVDDIWIPLGENMLIETFAPIWNRVIDGFGNKDPGNRRKTQYKSPWDVLHPGRKFADKLAVGPMTREFLAQRVTDYLAGRPLSPLPKAIADQISADETEVQELADEA